jgi:enoyl-[acyl-carrier protein] reductase II
MFKSTICELLGIKYPLIQGGMAWIAADEIAHIAIQEGV